MQVFILPLFSSMTLNVRKEEVSRLRAISFLVRVETILEGLVIQGDSSCFPL